MSSEEKTPAVAEGYSEHGQVVGYSDINNLVGRLLTYIDATYSDREQREAQKTLIKGVVFDWYEKKSQWNGSVTIEWVYGDSPQSPAFKKSIESFVWKDPEGTTFTANDFMVSGSTNPNK